MASRIQTVREKASGSLEVAVSGGLLFCFDTVDAKLLGVEVSRHRGGEADGAPSKNIGGNEEKARGSALSLSLSPEAELEEEEVEALGRLDSLWHARFYAMQIAARAEQGSRQLYEKLIHRGFAAEIARAAVGWMADKGFIDDRRYVRLLLKAHSVKRGQGLNRVQQLAWPRIGLFESQKRLITEAFECVEDEDMADAVRKSAEQALRKGFKTSRAIGAARRLDPGADSLSGEESDDEGARSGGRKDLRGLLRAHLRRQGFPGHAIETYLESWEQHDISK